MTDPTIGPQPHPEEATLRWRVGLIGIIAAAITALAGFGAQLWAANVNASTQHDVARSNFNLNQKLAAYSKLQTDEYAFRVAAEATLNTLSKPFSVAVFLQQRDALDAAMTTLQQDDSVIALIGSDVVARDSNDLIQANLTIHGSIKGLTAALKNDVNVLETPAVEPLLLTPVRDSYDRTYAVGQRFTQDAHFELTG